MELLCPHCLKKVTVSDDKAGQVLNCPLCQGVFAAPSLPPAPPQAPLRAAPPPAPPPMSTAPSPFAMQPLEPLPPVSTSVAAGQPPPTPVPPPPPKPPADYSRRFAFCLRPDVLVFFAPVCLFLILFVLSFFGWHSAEHEAGGLNLWLLGVSSQGTGLFMAYIFLTILTFLAAMVCAVLELGIVPITPQLSMLLPWKSGITLVLLALTAALFAYDYQQGLFMGTPFGNPIMLAEKLAFRLHLLALIAAALEVWVQSRVARNLPLPRFTMKL